MELFLSLLFIKKEQNHAISKKKDGIGDNHIRGNEPEPENQISHVFFFMPLQFLSEF